MSFLTSFSSEEISGSADMVSAEKS